MTNTIETAITMPSGSELSSKITPRLPTCQATAIAARNPTSIAIPPTCGIGVVWTERAFGSTSQPRGRYRFATNRTAGVTTNVTTAATAPTTR